MRPWNGALGLALLVGVLLDASCGSSGTSGNSTALAPTTSSTVSQLRDAAVEAMNAVQSYRAELDFGSTQPYIAEFQRPANYHVVLGEKDATGANQGAEELRIVGNTVFGRHCAAVETSCGSWQQQPRGQTVGAGPSPSYFPQWPVVALEQAEGLAFVSRESVAGSSATHVRGSVRVLRAIFENERRLVTAMGGSSFGMECSSSVTPVRVDASATPLLQSDASATPVGGAAPPTASCRSLTFEEELARQSGLPYSDAHPATIDAWIDDETHLVGRLELTEPQPDETQLAIVVTYSMFNGVNIEAP